MPNDVMNRFKTTKGMDEFLDKFYDSEKRRLDFNRIIPMPDTVRVAVSNGYLEDVLKVYNDYKSTEEVPAHILKRINPDIFKDEDIGYHDMIPYMGNTSKLIISSSKNLYSKNKDSFTPNESYRLMYDLGKIYQDNITSYGYPTWYEWSCANWGTKWNSYNGRINPSTGELMFLTAWAPPINIYHKLHEMGYRFTVSFADEDFGRNCGTIDATGDEILNIPFSPNHDVAYQQAAAVWVEPRQSHK